MSLELFCTLISPHKSPIRARILICSIHLRLAPEIKLVAKLHWNISSTSKSTPDWVTYGVKLGCKRAPGTLSPYFNTGFCWNLNTSVISGGERRCIKHIKICAPMGASWGGIRVWKISRDIISLSKHRILLKFEYKLDLWWRTEVY